MTKHLSSLINLLIKILSIFKAMEMTKLRALATTTWAIWIQSSRKTLSIRANREREDPQFSQESESWTIMAIELRHAQNHLRKVITVFLIVLFFLLVSSWIKYKIMTVIQDSRNWRATRVNPASPFRASCPSTASTWVATSWTSTVSKNSCSRTNKNSKRSVFFRIGYQSWSRSRIRCLRK